MLDNSLDPKKAHHGRRGLTGTETHLDLCFGINLGEDTPALLQNLI
jgi:hypothetical protein